MSGSPTSSSPPGAAVTTSWSISIDGTLRGCQLSAGKLSVGALMVHDHLPAIALTRQPQGTFAVDSTCGVDTAVEVTWSRVPHRQRRVRFVRAPTPSLGITSVATSELFVDGEVAAAAAVGSRADVIFVVAVSGLAYALDTVVGTVATMKLRDAEAPRLTPAASGNSGASGAAGAMSQLTQAGLVVARERIVGEEVAPPMIARTFGVTKSRVTRATLRSASEVSKGTDAATGSRSVLVAYFRPLAAGAAGSVSTANREARARVREVLLSAVDLSEHVVRAVGCLLSEDSGTIDAVIYEDTPNVEYVLQTVLLRKDIDVLAALPYFVRQLLAMLTRAEGSRGGGVVFRNLDPSKIVIYRRAADRSMAVRLMDASGACGAWDTASTHSLAPGVVTYDQHTPEGRPCGLGAGTRGRVTAATDVLCVGLIIAQALLGSTNFGAHGRGEFERLRDAGPEALRAAVRRVSVRQDNGLRELALAALDPDPSRRPTPLSALGMLRPGLTLTPVFDGQLSQTALERPYASQPEWWNCSGLTWRTGALQTEDATRRAIMREGMAEGLVAFPRRPLAHRGGADLDDRDRIMPPDPNVVTLELA